jgi:hypothetical protein
LFGENRHFAHLFVEPHPRWVQNARAAVNKLILSNCEGRARDFDQCSGSAEERTCFHGRVAGARPTSSTSTPSQSLHCPSRPRRGSLDLLFGSVQGEPGSRYYNMVERRTRCVTIHHADRMHIGLTPGVLWMPALPRTSVLFHHKPDDEFEPTYRLLANPWGFAQVQGADAC